MPWLNLVLALLSEVSLAAFKRYGIKLKNINFDTTSKVMCGEYKSEDGDLESIEISFEYNNVIMKFDYSLAFQ